MPVVVAYNPVAAVAKMGRNVFAADERARLDALNARNIGRGGGGGDASGGGYVPAPRTPPQQGAVAPQAQVFYGKDAANNPANAGVSDYALPGSDTQTGVDEATGQPAQMPAVPKTLKVTSGQKMQLDNLKATGATGDAYDEGMRKIMGIAEPMVDYTGPDGQTYRVPQKSAPALVQRDAAAKAKMEGQQTALDMRDKWHQQATDLGYDKLSQSWDDSTRKLQAHSNDTDAANNLKLKQMEQTTQNLQDRIALTQAEKAYKNSVAQATADLGVATMKRKNYLSEHPNVKQGDPGLQILDKELNDAAYTRSAAIAAGEKLFQPAPATQGGAQPAPGNASTPPAPRQSTAAPSTNNGAASLHVARAFLGTIDPSLPKDQIRAELIRRLKQNGYQSLPDGTPLE